jgi:hypothetical protein
MNIVLITALVTLFACPQVVTAPETGSLTGKVFDQTNAVLPGVRVDLISGGRTSSAFTDSQGQYRFDGVAAGLAELTFRLINFAALRRDVTVVAGRPVTIDVVLTLSLNADVVVTGARTFRNIADAESPAENLVGIASAASQGAITAQQLAVRPVMRTGEVLEAVPGLIVSQHSGEGKANQYYLRGFNLDHGTDFATTVAGVPVNTPTGAHAHGYADVGFLIPELVSGVQFKKGPYFADEGDFSAAGAANINYVNHVDRPFLHLSMGQDGWGRILGAASPRIGHGFLLAAVDLNHNNGPWERPDHYRKLSSVVRYSRGDNRNGFSATGTGYWADWNSTDQVPERAITTGALPRFGGVDPTDKGTTNRQTFSAEYQRSSGASSLRASGFLLHNRLDLFSNFTYFLNDPEHGDQFEQSESRIAAGGRITYRRLGRFFEHHTESAVGVQLRHDRLSPVGLYLTEARSRLSTVREDDVDQTMIGVYAQTEVEWTRAVRTTFGLRADGYRFSVTSDNAINSGDGADARLSPKLAAIFGPWARTEIYVNAGLGFHSNDARGAVIRVDPKTGEPTDPVTPLVRAKGAELGVRTVRLRGLQSTVALWYLGLDSELLFVGDAGTTEAGRPSRRLGVEWANYFRPARWLTLDGDVSFSRARFTDDDPAGDHIPGALDRVISGGVTIQSQHPLLGSLRVRHFGPRPLIEDASVKSNATTLLNGELGYRISSKAQLVLEIFNLLDAKVSDIDYFYTSRLAGEALDGIADVHTHPALPRSARFGVKFAF